MKVMNVARAVCSVEGFVGDEVDELHQDYYVQLKGLQVMEFEYIARAMCSVEGFVGDEVDERGQGFVFS